MQDVRCRKCGEPNSVYSLRHEVPDWDGQPEDAYDKVLSGEGCPTCDWGDKAGDVSTSRSKSDDELLADYYSDLMNNTDEDPLKFI